MDKLGKKRILLTDDQRRMLAVKGKRGGPNLNAYLERYFRSMKTECLDRMIFFGQRSLERSLKHFAAHYHEERNHQGLGDKLIDPGNEVGQEVGKIPCRERLGGMLRYFYRDAA